MCPAERGAHQPSWVHCEEAPLVVSGRLGAALHSPCLQPQRMAGPEGPPRLAWHRAISLPAMAGLSSVHTVELGQELEHMPVVAAWLPTHSAVLAGQKDPQRKGGRER